MEESIRRDRTSSGKEKRTNCSRKRAASGSVVICSVRSVQSNCQGIRVVKTLPPPPKTTTTTTTTTPPTTPTTKDKERDPYR
ncbi:hypothetical protein V1477_012029 [Vespula maculifrons]|uniref:Uncharacterized protein n=1 Tax=Vespula maculifrons TaxID=7453 RepID=A0ABD2C1F0_VESMC